MPPVLSTSPYILCYILTASQTINAQRYPSCCFALTMTQQHFAEHQVRKVLGVVEVSHSSNCIASTPRREHPELRTCASENESYFPVDLVDCFGKTWLHRAPEDLCTSGQVLPCCHTKSLVLIVQRAAKLQLLRPAGHVLLRSRVILTYMLVHSGRPTEASKGTERTFSLLRAL